MRKKAGVVDTVIMSKKKGHGQARDGNEETSTSSTRTSNCRKLAVLDQHIGVDDLVVSSSQAGLMDFSEAITETNNDEPLQSDSVSILMKEIGRESSNYSGGCEQEQDKAKSKGKRNIVRRGDKRILKVFNSPCNSLDDLVVSFQEEWQLSLIPEWMPGCRPVSESPSSSSKENNASLSYNDALFAQPTFSTSMPLHHHVSAMKADKQRKDKQTGTVASSNASGKKGSVAPSELNDCDGAVEEMVETISPSPLAVGMSSPVSERPSLASETAPRVTGTGNPNLLLELSADKMTYVRDGDDSNSLFSDSETEDSYNSSHCGTREIEQTHRTDSTVSGGEVKKIRTLSKIIERDTGSANSTHPKQNNIKSSTTKKCVKNKADASLSSASTGKSRRELENVLSLNSSSSIVEFHTEASSSSLSTTPRTRSSQKNEVSTEKAQIARENTPTFTLDSESKHSNEMSPLLDSSLEIRYRMVDDCLVNVLQVLMNPSEHGKDDAHSPTSSKDKPSSQSPNNQAAIESCRSENKDNEDTTSGKEKLAEPDQFGPSMQTPTIFGKSPKAKRHLYAASPNFPSSIRSEMKQPDELASYRARNKDRINLHTARASELSLHSSFAKPRTKSLLQGGDGAVSETPPVNTSQLGAHTATGHNPSTGLNPRRGRRQQKRDDVVESATALQSGSRQITNVLRRSESDQCVGKAIVSESIVKSPKRALNQTTSKVVKIKRKRHAVYIVNVPANCGKVKKIIEGTLLTESMLSNPFVKRLVTTGQLLTTVKEEIIDVTDDNSNTVSSTASTSRRSHKRKNNVQRGKSHHSKSKTSKLSHPPTAEKRNSCDELLSDIKMELDDVNEEEERVASVRTMMMPPSAVILKRSPGKATQPATLSPSKILPQRSNHVSNNAIPPSPPSIFNESQGFVPIVKDYELAATLSQNFSFHSQGFTPMVTNVVDNSQSQQQYH